MQNGLVNPEALDELNYADGGVSYCIYTGEYTVLQGCNSDDLEVKTHNVYQTESS